MTRQSVLEALSRHDRLFIRAYVFGSVARGECDEHSDADVVFVRETGRDFFHRIADLMDIVLELGNVDALIYTPDEFARLKADSGFIQTVIEEAIEVEGKQKRS